MTHPTVDSDQWEPDQASELRVFDSPPWPSVRLRFLLFYLGVVSPIFCLSLNAWLDSETRSVFDNELWQSGDESVYRELLLHSDTIRFFLPLIGFSIVALGAWCIRPSLQRLMIIRFLIWLGLFLTIHFAVLAILVHQFIPIAGAGLIAVFVGIIELCIRFAPRMLKQFGIKQLLFLTFVAAVMAAIARGNGILGLIGLVLGAPVLATILGAPAGALTAFWISVIAISKNAPLKNQSLVLKWWASLFIWFGLYLGAWRLAILDLIAHYNRLPLEPSDCFVCSACASGHRVIVGSQVAIHGGTMYLVNRQMRSLKFLEFAIASSFPRFHVRFRKVYNSIGPKVAARCRRNKILADWIYLCLKPLEIFAHLLSLALSIDRHQIDCIYPSSIPNTINEANSQHDSQTVPGPL